MPVPAHQAPSSGGDANAMFLSAVGGLHSAIQYVLSTDSLLTAAVIFLAGLLAYAAMFSYGWLGSPAGLALRGRKDGKRPSDAQLRKLMAKHTQGWRHFLSFAVCMAALALSLANGYAALDPHVQPVLNCLSIATTTWRAAGIGRDILHMRMSKDMMGADKRIISGFAKSLDIVIFAIGAVCFLNCIPSVNLKSITASLGIVSLGISLAAQDLMKDILAFFSIKMSYPFFKGDYIHMNDKSGWVEGLQLRHTLVRNDEGLLMAIPNKSLIEQVVANDERNTFRLIQEQFVIASDCSLDDLENFLKEVPEMIHDKFPLSRRIRDARYRSMVKETSCRVISMVHTGLTVELTVIIDNIKQPGKGADSFLQGYEFKSMQGSININILRLLEKHNLVLASKLYSNTMQDMAMMMEGMEPSRPELMDGMHDEDDSQHHHNGTKHHHRSDMAKTLGLSATPQHAEADWRSPSSCPPQPAQHQQLSARNAVRRTAAWRYMRRAAPLRTATTPARAAAAIQQSLAALPKMSPIQARTVPVAMGRVSMRTPF